MIWDSIQNFGAGLWAWLILLYSHRFMGSFTCQKMATNTTSDINKKCFSCYLGYFLDVPLTLYNIGEVLPFTRIVMTTAPKSEFFLLMQDACIMWYIISLAVWLIMILWPLYVLWLPNLASGTTIYYMHVYLHVWAYYTAEHILSACVTPGRYHGVMVYAHSYACYMLQTMYTLGKVNS